MITVGLTFLRHNHLFVYCQLCWCSPHMKLASVASGGKSEYAVISLDELMTVDFITEASEFGSMFTSRRHPLWSTDEHIFSFDEHRPSDYLITRKCICPTNPRTPPACISTGLRCLLVSRSRRHRIRRGQRAWNTSFQNGGYTLFLSCFVLIIRVKVIGTYRMEGRPAAPAPTIQTRFGIWNNRTCISVYEWRSSTQFACVSPRVIYAN